MKKLLILLIIFASCKKDPKENPQPIVKTTTSDTIAQTKEYSIQIVGQTSYRLEYHGTIKNGVFGTIPTIKLISGETIKFIDYADANQTRHVIFYVDGVVYKEVTNNQLFEVTYTAQ